jgi:hypothetical protein
VLKRDQSFFQCPHRITRWTAASQILHKRIRCSQQKFLCP